MCEEIWKDIPWRVGKYQVSNLGRVRSVDRVVEQRGPNGLGMRRNLKGQLLSPTAFPNGYLGVYLGKGRSNLVHRLVALVFIEGDKSLQVNHKNGIRSDNRAANLEWLTCSDNHRHSYRELPRKKHALTKAVILQKENRVLQFESESDAARALGVVAGSVASAAQRHHRCLGYEVHYG